ncbi:uncharacterized protein [Rhodnius prolixus]|uniref:uncharacterized protein n=1 Tax=Rhodnius prolixus TaxID=13249 RepID=UPI003D189A49
MISEIKENTEIMKNKVNDLEKRIAFLEKVSDETVSDTSKPEDWHKLRLDITLKDIDYIRRLGRKESKRPILVRLISYRTKIEILRNCHKLRGSECSVSEDFPVGVRKELSQSIRQDDSASSTEEGGSGGEAKERKLVRSKNRNKHDLGLLGWLQRRKKDTKENSGNQAVPGRKEVTGYKRPKMHSSPE